MACFIVGHWLIPLAHKGIQLKQRIKNLPFLGPIAVSLYRTWIRPPREIESSESYWVERYKKGGDSGPGSYKHLAQFKAELLNAFVSEHSIQSAIEFGCGDGNQLALAEYPSYVGFDVSPKAIELCRQRFARDASKAFSEMKDFDGEQAELTLSLDVIFHLVEDEVFEAYMNRLFDSSTRFVVIYSSNRDVNETLQGKHVRHREFLSWVRRSKPQWTLITHIPNRYPFQGDQTTGSHCDFFVFAKADVPDLRTA